jgi:hypothetical protein
MPDQDSWNDDFRRRSEESERRFQASERRFYARLRQLDRRFVVYLIAIAACWIFLAIAIKVMR